MKNLWKGKEPVIGNMPAFVKHNDRVVQAGGRMTDSEGNINAQDKKELIQKISALAAMGSNGAISEGGDDAGAVLSAKAEKFEDFRAAYTGRDSERTMLHAEVMAEELWETLNRQGFTNTLFARKDTPDSVDTRIKLRRKDVTAFQVINDGEGIAQMVEQAYIYPPDYYLQCEVLIEERELAQAGPELMDEKFADALEAIMVKQDRILRSLLLASAGSFNAPVSFATFSPQTLTTLRTQVQANGIPAANLTMSFDIWDDIIADPSFTAWLEPVHKYQLIMDGKLGSLLGMNIITDGFRYETLKVLEAGEVFVTGTPTATGIRCVRRELQATEINQYVLGKPNRGIYFMALEAMAGVNDRAVSQGSRA